MNNDTQHSFLKMTNVTKSYPGVRALRNVDFELEASEIHVLLGANGAGKSTLIKILAGAEQMDSGSIAMNGIPVDIRSPMHAKQLGVCTVYQEFMLVPQLTVAENIHLGQRVTKNGLVDWNKINSNAQLALDRLGFEIDILSEVGRLSVHEQQVVEIAKALALDAKVLVLDEPTAALTNKETERLFEILVGLRDEGVGIVYISHNLEEVKLIGDRATVLRDGKKVATVLLKDTAINELPKLMVGEEVKEPYPRNTAKRGDRILSVKNCSDDDGRYRKINFELHAGEIISFSGLLGSGNEEFIRSLIGLRKPPVGEIEIFGQPYSARSPNAAIKAGVFYLPADRKSEGLILSMSVADNSTLSALDKYTSLGLISKADQIRDCEMYQRSLNIKTPSLDTISLHLSGGNQQKVMIARALSAKSKIIIFNEPTRGVDVRAKVEIYKLLNKLVADGAGIIFISQELSEMIGMSDRILIWRGGEIVETVLRKDSKKELILGLITGV